MREERSCGFDISLVPGFVPFPPGIEDFVKCGRSRLVVLENDDSRMSDRKWKRSVGGEDLLVKSDKCC